MIEAEERGNNTLNFNTSPLLPRTDIHQKEPRRSLAQASKERLKHFWCADVLRSKHLVHPPFIKVDRDPEGQPAENLQVFLGEVFRDTPRQFLCGDTTAVMALRDECGAENMIVGVDNAENERALVL